MKKTTDLEIYFNIEFKDQVKTEFKDITVIEKQWIEKSIDFNIWRMNIEMRRIVIQIKRMLNQDMKRLADATKKLGKILWSLKEKK